jgi:hypothetical protein
MEKKHSYDEGFKKDDVFIQLDSSSIRIPSSTTLYPKIGKLTDFTYQVKRSRSFEDKRTIALIGTAKLHGTHADVVIESDGSIRFQSRNRLNISPGKDDNQGFAAFASTLKKEWLDLKNRYTERFQALNPDTVLDRKQQVVIAGEWCGEGIMKGVAISKVPPMFVVLSVQINGDWVLDEEYGDISCEEVRVFNISKAGFFHHDFQLNDIDASKAVIQALVEKVEKECPFGAALGISGKGEGIVWKPRDLHQNSELWFKTKGDSFTVSTSHKLPPSAVAIENRKRWENFARSVVTEQRLEQGWEYLKEMNHPQDMSGLGIFLEWVNKDVMAEEVREIEMLQIEKGPLGRAIVSIAKPWFLERYKREGNLSLERG